MRVRVATPDDAAAIADIYAHHVRFGTGTFEEQAPGVEEMATRLARVQAFGWPWLVAESAGAVAGYGYATQFRDRPGYRFAGEDSIYVRPDRIGQGIGTALLAAVLDAAAVAGFRRMFAMIGDAENMGSIRLHAAFGFAPAGRLHDAGYKFDRWLDVILMERELP